MQFPEEQKKAWDTLASINNLSEWPSDELTLTQLMRSAEPGSIERRGLLLIVIHHAKFSPPEKRQELIEWLTENILAATRRSRGDILRLLVFPPDDFSWKARQHLHRHCNYLRHPPGELFLLIALLGEHGRYMEEISSIASTIQWPDDADESEMSYNQNYEPFYLPGGRAWTCLQILAREGDRDSIDKIIAIYKRAEQISPVTVIESLDRLWYVHQPEIVELLKWFLDSDEVVKTDVGDFRYIAFAHRTLRQMLRGYPKNLLEAREWMNNQTEWDFLEYWERPED